MNIAIDVLAILGPGSKNRGIGNYTTSQLKTMLEMDKDNQYFLLNFYEDICLKNILEYSDNASEYYFYMGKDGYLCKNKMFKPILGDLIKHFIKTYDIDVFYFTSPFDGSISYDMNWFSDVKTVATLYDIIPYVFKERYLGNKDIYKEYMGWINNIKKADKLLAISQSAKDDVIKHFKIEPNKIDVIYAGVEDYFKKLNITNSELEIIKEKYNIKDQFIMCTGGDDDRKNIEGLIVAFSKMPKELIDKYQLVVACKLSQYSEDIYYGIAKKYNVRERVILTNFIPLDDLIKLYNLAYVVAFPSQYEGFGLPVVEAMACGTPVLTSNNSSLGEIAQGAAVLVDPFDVNQISKGLVNILTKQDLVDLIERGYERIKNFSWGKVALNTINAINGINYKNINAKGDKKKIAFFTPLPPIQSGISDYSVDILNELSEYLEIDVYIDKGYSPNCNLKKNINIFKYNIFDSKRDEYEEVIFQMGNSEYHAYMINYIKKYSGILVLHDYNLHGLMYFYASQKGDMELYKEFLYEDYPKDTIDKYVEDFSTGRTQIKYFEYPTNGAVINYANKIIVHSDYSKKLILEKSISRNVRKILLYSEIKELMDKKILKEKYKIQENQLILSAFGHIHETKRIMPMLKAFNCLSEKHDNIKLYLVGKPSPSIKDELEQYINRNNLGGRVIVTGFTDLDTFEEYIDISDICLNLRYPYNGETSASLMRILAKGKCTIVNNLGSFSEIPDNSCVKVESPEDLTEEMEIELITKTLENLITHPERVQSIGNNARKYAEENLNLKDIAIQYLNFINSTYSSNLSDSIIKELADFIEKNHGINNEELFKIANTLSFCK